MHNPHSLPHRLSPPSTPLLYPAIALLLGTLLGLCFPLPRLMQTCIAALAVLTAAGLLIYRRWAICALIVCLTVGWVNALLHVPADIPPEYQEGSRYFTGTVSRIHETETSTIADVNIDSVGISPKEMVAVSPIKVQLTVAGFNYKIAQATRIRWVGNLRDSNAKRLSMMDDLRSHARRRGIACATVIRADAITDISDEPGLLNALSRCRSHIADAIYGTAMSPVTTEFLTVVLLGDTEMLTPDRRETYTAAGLSHILALSGMHVAIIALLISIALFPLMLSYRHRALIIATVMALWCYAAITGFSPSVTRAVVMASVYAGARLLQRRSSPYNSLCLAAILIVLADPYSLMSYSFQLSFAAVAGIIAFSGVLTFVNPRRRVMHALVGCITLPIAAMSLTGFLGCYYFHSFPLYFIPSAVVATTLLPIICIGGVIATVLHLMHFGGLAYTTTCNITDLAVRLLDKTAQFISSLPHAINDNIQLSPESLLLFLAAVVTTALCLNMRKRVYGYAALMLTAAAVGTLYIRQEYAHRDVVALIVPDKSYTTLLIRDTGTALVYSDASGTDTLLVKQRIKRDFDSFLRLTATDSLKMAHYSQMVCGDIYLIKGFDKAILADAASRSDSTDTYIVITGKTKMSEIRNAPWELLAGHQITVIPSPALRPTMASTIVEKCKEYGIAASDTLVLRHQSMSIKSLGI